MSSPVDLAGLGKGVTSRNEYLMISPHFPTLDRNSKEIIAETAPHEVHIVDDFNKLDMLIANDILLPCSLI